MTTLGEMLVEARKQAGLSAHDVAQRTRIMQSSILALEGDRHNALPVAGYVRGYILSYCKVCGVAPEPYLEQYERQSGNSRRDSISGEPFSYGGGFLNRRGEHEMTWKVVIVAALVIVGIAAAIFFIGQGGDDSTPDLNPVPAETTVTADAGTAEGEDANNDEGEDEELTSFSFSVEAREGRASNIRVIIDGNEYFNGSLTSGDDIIAQDGAYEVEFEIESPENVRITRNEDNIVIPDSGEFTMTSRDIRE